MKVTVLFTPAMLGSDTDLRSSSVVVLDTFRATSTIITALAAGAREVIAAATIEEAVAIAHRLGTERTLLAGERGGLRINGFHLGNSPAEYTPEVVHGKTIVMTTSNGTPALVKARQAAHAYCGAMLNAAAVAERAVTNAQGDLLLVCAGSNGNVSLEDTAAAGAIVAEILSLVDNSSLLLTDGARVALMTYLDIREDIQRALRTSDHGRALIDLGFAHDVDYCSQLNLADASVPELIGSSIKLPAASAGAKTVARFV